MEKKQLLQPRALACPAWHCCSPSPCTFPKELRQGASTTLDSLWLLHQTSSQLLYLRFSWTSQQQLMLPFRSGDAPFLPSGQGLACSTPPRWSLLFCLVLQLDALPGAQASIFCLSTLLNSRDTCPAVSTPPLIFPGYPN